MKDQILQEETQKDQILQEETQKDLILQKEEEGEAQGFQEESRTD